MCEGEWLVRGGGGVDWGRDPPQPGAKVGSEQAGGPGRAGGRVFTLL